MPINLKSVKNLILLQRSPKIRYLSFDVTLMNSPKPRRKRGVILTSIGWEKLQRSIRESEIGENFGRYTWEELSDRTCLDPDTIAKVTNRKVGVDKRTLELFFQAFNLELTASDYFQPSSSQPSQQPSYTREDLSEAIDVSFFLGRTTELAQLQQWIVGEGCRVVALLGMGGIGKTALSVKLAHQIKHKFEYIIWRSLRTAPPIKDLLTGLILFLSNEQLTETALPKTVDSTITLLIRYLQNHHCLLILDNLEAILQSGEHTGYYRPGYEDYGELLKRIGEIPHQSCVVITSREKPEELALLEGETLPVHLLQLTGLQQVEGWEILKAKGVFGTEAEINKIIDYYRGNPLALKIIATSIKELFAGDIFEFISQSTTVFKGIRQLLEQQFNRLSDIEKQTLYWLAINQEPISIAELQDDFIPSVARQSLLEALESLSRRCLIEQSKDNNCASKFTLQPVVMEYVTDCLVQQVCAEITGVSEDLRENKTSSPSPLTPHSSPLFNTHALLKAQAKEYVRDTQTRLILKAIVDKLYTVYYHKNNIQEQLIKLLFIIRERSPRQPGYAAGNILNLLCQMETNLSGYDFSYLSVWQAHLAKVNLHNVNFQNADLAKSVFASSFGGVLSVALSQDDKLLATGDSNGEIHIWQVENGKQLVTCKGHTGWIRSVAFSPDNTMIVSGCSDHAVRLWDVRDGKCLQILQEHTNRVRCVVFSPGGNTLASGSDDCSVKLWDVKTGQCLITLQQHTNRVRCVVFNPEGTILASASDDHTVILWDVRTGKVLKTLQAHKDGVRSVAFHPGGKILASGGEDKVVRLWDVSTGQCLNTLQGHRDGVWSLTFNPEGNMLASGSHDQTIRLWDINTGQTLRTLQGHTSWVWSVVFADVGQTLVSGGADQTAKLWDVGSGQCIRTWQGRSNGVWAVAFCPVGETYSHKYDYILASVSDDKTVRLWDVSNGQTLQTFSGHSSGVWSIAISPDGQILASGSDDQTVRLWDITTSQVRTLQGHTGWVWSVAFSPAGKILASSGADQTIRLWDVTAGQVIKILQGHTSIVRSVAFSQDGQFLVSGSVDKTVRLWDVNTGQVLGVLQGHARPVSSVSFSPEGRIVASGSDDGTVKLWDVRTGKCDRTLQAHTDWIQSVTFNPDGNILASGSHDRTIKLWDVKTGQVLRTLQGHTGWIWSVAFSPGGETLASSSQDGTIKVWDVLTGECLKTLRSARPYEGMNITGATSLSVATIATLKALGAVEFESAVDNKIIHISQKSARKGRSAG